MATERNTLIEVYNPEVGIVSNIKVEAPVADWLSDSIDAEDVETLTAFRDWLRVSYGHGTASFVVQEAWAELSPGGGAEETVH